MRVSLFILLNLIGFLSFGQNLDLARQYMEQGQYVKAIEIYEDMFNRTASQTIYEEYTNCLRQLEDYKQLEKVIKKQLKRGNMPIYWVDLGLNYKIQGKEDKQQDSYKDAISLLKDNPGYTTNLANHFIKNQELEWALACYKEGTKLMPGANFNLQIAEIYAQQEKMEAFFKEYLDLIGSNRAYLQTAKNRLRRVIDEDPDYEANKILRDLLLDRIQSNNSEVYIDLLTWLFIQEKNFDMAYVQLKALDKRSRGDQKRIYDLARIARNNKAYAVSVKCYNYIIEVGPGSNYYLDAKLNVLSVLREQIVNRTGDDMEALKNLEKAYISTMRELESSIQHASLSKDLAHLLAFDLNKADTAQLVLEAALEKTLPNTIIHSELKLELADIYLFLGYQWDAILMYGQIEKAFKEDIIGQEAKFRRARVYYYTGEFGFAQGQLDVLKASTTKYIANDAMKLSLLISDNIALDTSTVALEIYARADLAYYQKDFDRALAGMDTLINIHLANAIIDEAYFKKAEILSAKGDFIGAAEILEEICRNFSYDLYGDNAFYLLGKIYEEQFDDQTKAMEMYKTLLERYPGSVFTVEARKRFRTLRGDQLNPEP